MRRTFFLLLFSAAMLCLPRMAGAAIADSTRIGFTVRYDTVLSSDARTIYDTFCKDIGKWWDPNHTWSGKAENLYIQQYVGGCFGERWENGGGTRHMNVIYTDPGKMLRMEGGIGPLQQFPVTGIMTLELKPEGNKTKVSLTYSVGGYAPGGVTKFANAVEYVLGQQFLRFSGYMSNKK